MSRARRVIGLTLVLLLASSPGWALWGSADYLLSVINTVLQEVATVRMALQATLQGDVLGTYMTVFPGSADVVAGTWRDIGLVAREMRTVRSDIQRLSCGWRFTARTLSLRDGLLAPVRFCKPGFQVTWGVGSGWTADLEELHDAVGSMGLNVLSSRAGAEDGSWAVIWPSIEDGAEHLRRSPGEANRDEALALAGADLMAQQNGNLEAMRLLVNQGDHDFERFLERKETDFCAYLLTSLEPSSQSDGPFGDDLR